MPVDEKPQLLKRLLRNGKTKGNVLYDEINQVVPRGYEGGAEVENIPNTSRRVLDIGCGINKTPGAIGLDFNLDATAADVIADLNLRLPFADNVFDEVRAVHVIEHVFDIMYTMSEIHRVTKPGGGVYLVTPHYTDPISWKDPTHRWHLSSYSFDYFDRIHGERHWYTRLELHQRNVHIELASVWKWMGVEWLVNHSRPFRRFWELYLCFMVRGKQMEFTFEVVK